MTKSADGKFKIIANSRDDDSYFYSDSDTSFQVVSTEFGDELAVFSGHSYSGRGGTTTGGIERVDFDRNFVVAYPYEGKA